MFATLRSLFVLCFLSIVAGAEARAKPVHGGHGGHGGHGKIVVANRASGTVSVIDVATDTVTHTLTLPGAGATPEPMYVVAAARRIFVGDRANDCVAVFDARSLDSLGTLPAGEGVFHMWADPLGRELWVVNDVDKTLSVLDTRRLRPIATVPIPADIAALGGKPHDVSVDFRAAYVSMVGLPGDDCVVRFDRRSLQETARALTGKDPHVSLSVFSRSLFVPAQNTDTVFELERWNLDPVDQLAVPGAHGAGMRFFGDVLYTTNLPGGGPDGLVAIDTRRGLVLGATDTPYPTPHNVALTPSGRKIYVTHSGATADKVTVYSASWLAPVPTYVGEVTVGTNPFGLAYVR